MVGSDRSGQKPRVVVVDDESLILESWQETLSDDFEVRLFSDPLAAQRFFETDEVDVALLDVRMPGVDGMTLLRQLKQQQPRAEAIMVTGHGSIELAVEAIQQGAYDFLCKPVEDLAGCVRRIASAADRKRLREVNASLQQRLAAFGPETELIGESRPIQKIRELIGQIVDSTAPVLICGESGTGKELAARALHSQSPRRERPFLTVNCAAMTETLIDSELFGHERGAFTGATTSHRGLFEAAHGGVLFLDEIGDVPLQTQVRLLRALQEGEVRAVGSTRSRSVDVRVLAATNVNLEKAMRDGRFREDFYYRISTFRIDMPPLRARVEDVPLIAQHLLNKIAQRAKSSPTRFSDEALDLLARYDWPGNVRELNNAIEHAATLCEGDLMQTNHLPSFVIGQKGAKTRPSAEGEVGTTSSMCFSDARARLLEDFECRYLTDLLTVTNGNISEASRRSGVDRANLRRMLRRHCIQAEQFRT